MTETVGLWRVASWGWLFSLGTNKFSVAEKHICGDQLIFQVLLTTVTPICFYSSVFWLSSGVKNNSDNCFDEKSWCLPCFPPSHFIQQIWSELQATSRCGYHAFPQSMIVSLLIGYETNPSSTCVWYDCNNPFHLCSLFLVCDSQIFFSHPTKKATTPWCRSMTTWCDSTCKGILPFFLFFLISWASQKK